MGTVAYVANTNTLQLLGLKDELSGAYLNAATVLLTVHDKRGNAVSGELWPQNMGYVAGSNGNYEVGLSYLLALVNRKSYVAVIDADASNSDGEKVGHWEFAFTAQTRTD